MILNTSVPVVVLSTGYTGVAIARSLGRLGIAVYRVHADPASPPARSRYWANNFKWNVATAPTQETIAWLVGLGRSVGSGPILIPTDDQTCLTVADHAAALKQAFVFPDQPAGLPRALSSKEEIWYFLCKRKAIPTAETVFPRSRNDVVEFLDTARFPVMLKGVDTQALRLKSGIRMIQVRDATTLLELYEQLEDPAAPNLMIQEYIPGSSEMVWMFNGYFDAESNCVFGVTGRKLRQYPAEGGVTSLGICVANDAVATQTRAFMKSVNYRGIVDIGYKYDARTRQYKLLDVNPRIGATFRLFVDTAGLDVARTLYHLTNQTVETRLPSAGRRWVVENLDFVSGMTSLRRGRLSALGWLRSYLGLEEAAWFAWDDLAPFLTTMTRALPAGLRAILAG